jgi:formate/nitrite transporter
MLSAANAKTTYDFGQAVMLGLLCNVLVCLAVWMTYGARTLTDKVLAVVFPISLFVAAGFEHSVANMYIIPTGILLKTLDASFTVRMGIELSHLSWQSFLLGNLLPVTIGNILGGSLLVGLMYHFAYQKAH